MNTVIKINSKDKNKIINYYQPFFLDKKPQYSVFSAKVDEFYVTLYESGKMMFQGKNFEDELKLWSNVIVTKKKENKIIENSDKKYYYCNTMGSDEVGVGDYFGPIVVTASIVNQEDIEFLEELKIRDSKKISDEYILEIVPKLVKRIKYESIILNNKDYNKFYGENCNLNKIKALLHNKVLFKLKEKYNNYDYIIIDQFVEEKKYYEYLNESKNICDNIIFMTKAEDKVLSVACSSLISRYIFLKEIEKLSEEVDIFLPKGASNKVDLAGVEVVMKYNLDKLQEVAKVNFKNTLKIKEILDSK